MTDARENHSPDLLMACGGQGDSAYPDVMSKSAYGWYRRAVFGAGRPSLITKYIQSGMITAPALRSDGKIVRRLADAQLAEKLDPARTANPAANERARLVPEDARPAGEPGGANGVDPAAASPGDSDYARERTRLAAAQRQLRELELAEKRGEVVDRAAVARAERDTSRRVRDRLLSIPTKIAARLVGVTDARTAAQIVRDAINEALNEISDELDPDGGVDAVQ